MVLYYKTMVLLAIICMLVLLCIKKKTQMENSFLYIFLTILVTNVGFYLVSVSENVREAILATKITYVGGCFASPIFLFIIFDICNLKLSRWLKLGISSISIFVFCCAMNMGNNDLYYKNVDIIKVWGGTFLVKEYGPLHIFFPIMLYGFMVLQIAFTVFALLKRKNISYKSVLVLTMVEFITVTVYIVGRIFNSYLELQAIIFVMDDLVLLYLCHMVQKYHLSDNISMTLEKQDSQGYISFDGKKRFLGANALALELLPELEGCTIDKTIKEASSALNEIIGWMDELAIKIEFHGKAGAELTKEISIKNRHLKCKVRAIILRGKKTFAYLYELVDDTAQHNYTNLLYSYNNELEDTVREKTEHIANIQLQLVLGMSDVIENRDGNTGGHVKRTSDVVSILVGNIKKFQLFTLPEEFCLDIIKAAPMHDLGKIAIPDAILNKPGRLTPEEFAIMKSHPVKSADLAKSILEGVEEEHFVTVATNVARYHHEKWDGSGYPEGLKGDEIPFEARIMALADVYDALVSHRVYKEPMSFKEAYATIDEAMGTHFDPDLRTLFMLSNKDLKEYYKNSGSHKEIEEND